MVKLFGWEAKMRERVGDKREEELNYIWKKEVSPVYTLIYGLLPDIFKVLMAVESIIKHVHVSRITAFELVD